MRALAPFALILLPVLGMCNVPDPATPTADTLPVSGLPPTTVLRVVAPQEGRQLPAPTTTTVAVAPPPVLALPAPQWANWPSWRTTSEGVPYYSGRPACTYTQAGVIATQFAARGASIATQQWAIYVASREGGCNYLATNINSRTNDASHCAFQLNAIVGDGWYGPLHPKGLLGKLGWTPASAKASLENCAAAAAALWAECGKLPWTKPNYGCRRPTS